MAGGANVSSGGVSLTGLVFIVFLVLKLCHVISWSWWWVTAPLWGVFALILVVFIVGAIFALLKCVTEKPGKEWRG